MLHSHANKAYLNWIELNWDRWDWSREKREREGNFNKAVNDLRDKARRAFYAIKGNIKIDIQSESG